MGHGLSLMIVALGGAIGAVTRFQVTVWFANAFSNNFPYATLCINIAGSFVMGALMSALMNNAIVSEYWRPLIAVGFLGALTTFSTFAFDTFIFAQQGQWLKAGLNMVLNVGFCMVAVAIGYWLLAQLFPSA